MHLAPCNNRLLSLWWHADVHPSREDIPTGPDPLHTAAASDTAPATATAISLPTGDGATPTAGGASDGVGPEGLQAASSTHTTQQMVLPVVQPAKTSSFGGGGGMNDDVGDGSYKEATQVRGTGLGHPRGGTPWGHIYIFMHAADSHPQGVVLGIHDTVAGLRCVAHRWLRQWVLQRPPLVTRWQQHLQVQRPPLVI